MLALLAEYDANHGLPVRALVWIQDGLQILPLCFFYKQRPGHAGYVLGLFVLSFPGFYNSALQRMTIWHSCL